MGQGCGESNKLKEQALPRHAAQAHDGQQQQNRELSPPHVFFLVSRNSPSAPAAWRASTAWARACAK